MVRTRKGISLTRSQSPSQVVLHLCLVMILTKSEVLFMGLFDGIMDKTGIHSFDGHVPCIRYIRSSLLDVGVQAASRACSADADTR